MAVNTTCECRNSISVTKTRATGKVRFGHPRLRTAAETGIEKMTKNQSSRPLMSPKIDFVFKFSIVRLGFCV